MRIGELATRSGVSVRALRYYEEQGLLVPERSSSGQRHYSEDAVERVGFFQDMFSAGLTSKNIAELLPCVDTGHTDVEQRRMLHAERDRINGRLVQLKAALRRLDEVIAIADAHGDAHDDPRRDGGHTSQNPSSCGAPSSHPGDRRTRLS